MKTPTKPLRHQPNPVLIDTLTNLTNVLYEQIDQQVTVLLKLRELLETEQSKGAAMEQLSLPLTAANDPNNNSAA